MSTEAFYGYLAIALVVVVLATAAVKLLYSVNDRPSSELSILGLAFAELCGAHLFGWAARSTPWSSASLVAALGIIGIYLVDLGYLTGLRHQPLSLAWKRAALLTASAAVVISVIEGGAFFLIMMKAFSHGR